MARLRTLAAGLVTVGAAAASLVAAPPALAAPTCVTFNILYRQSGAWLADAPFGGGTFSCSLVVNNTGDGVRSLQRALNKCFGRGLAVDGRFGPLTRSALKYAQGVEGVSPDGAYGPITASVLKFPFYRDIDGRFAGCYRRA